jgi:hypothetical protein
MVWRPKSVKASFQIYRNDALTYVTCGLYVYDAHCDVCDVDVVVCPLTTLSITSSRYFGGVADCGCNEKRI